MMEVLICSFKEAEDSIRRIRNNVFVKEQGVSSEEEFDEKDQECVHVVVMDDNGLPIGTGRLGCDGRIGRIAVIRELRRTGLGSIIMSALEKHARTTGLYHLWAHAQVQALGFYEKLGYCACGEVFVEEGIPHMQIDKTIQPD